MRFSRTVWTLSLVSLFADVASEMLYPIMPVYLKSIGFSMAFIGLLEGVAEAVAGLSKGYFGRLSDRSGNRVGFVRWGYFFSAISKPLMAVLTFPFWVFLVRTLDRIGKGLRSGARDAMLSGEASPETKGRIFGFHRSMDTVGAALGPVLALIYLHFFPGNYAALFFIAFLPGLLSVGLTFLLKQKTANGQRPNPKTNAPSNRQYWNEAPEAYRKTVVGLAAFAFFNSSDAFLLLKMKSAGLSDTQLIGVYIFYNLVFAAAALPIGILADRLGLKKTYLAGLSLFVLTYAGFAANQNLWLFLALFFVYGIYAAATEGIAKAWISNICEKKDTGAAIGTYSGLQSVMALLASLSAGILWQFCGETAPFVFSAIGTGIVILYFLSQQLETQNSKLKT